MLLAACAAGRPAWEAAAGACRGVMLQRRSSGRCGSAVCLAGARARDTCASAAGAPGAHP